MVSTDSFLAGSIKLQVLTTSTSAWSGCGVSSWPLATSWPIITSLSTRFLGQPRLMKPTFKVVLSGYRSTGPRRWLDVPTGNTISSDQTRFYEHETHTDRDFSFSACRDGHGPDHAVVRGEGQRVVCQAALA